MWGACCELNTFIWVAINILIMALYHLGKKFTHLINLRQFLI
jgi:hypothetical protein